jgi:polar amino acid transport system ATP-binding protein
VTPVAQHRDMPGERLAGTEPGDSPRPPVAIRNACKAYDALRVLDDVTLTVERGEKLVVIGASGSGKTTLLRALVGLVELDSGTIEIDGEPVVDRPEGAKDRVSAKRARAIRSRTLGMVFQSFNLFPHFTALQNVIEAPIHVRKVPRREAVARAEELLNRVGLLEWKDHHPSRLSGGQQQRVAIARALAMDPEILLFDEVTSALDPELIGEVLDVMQTLAEAGQTMIVVTHEMGFARQVANRVAFMDEGRVIESGAPEDVLVNPSHERTRKFLSKVLHLR